MNLTAIAISAFIFLEVLNVIILYFAPQSKKGNGIGVFKAFEKSKEVPEGHALIRYLVNWVAGTKLIFIALLIVVVFKADFNVQLLSLLALILSISTFYWRLFPLLKRMDVDNQLEPKGYSKTLAIMIAGIIFLFTVALLSAYYNLF